MTTEWEDEDDDDNEIQEQSLEDIWIVKKLSNETGRFAAITDEFGNYYEGIIESVVGGSVFLKGLDGDSKVMFRIPCIASYFIGNCPKETATG